MTDWNARAQAEMQMKALDQDPATKAPKINTVAIPADKVITQDAFDLLVSKVSQRTALFCWFMYNTGCRVAEACSARLDKCEDLGEMVRITVLGKGRKERKVEIEKALFDAIRQCFNGSTFVFETTRGNPYLTTYVSDEIAKAGHRILGRKISAHTMRHYSASVTIAELPQGESRSSASLDLPDTRHSFAGSTGS